MIEMFFSYMENYYPLLVIAILTLAVFLLCKLIIYIKDVSILKGVLIFAPLEGLLYIILRIYNSHSIDISYFLLLTFKWSITTFITLVLENYLSKYISYTFVFVLVFILSQFVLSNIFNEILNIEGVVRF